MRALLRHFLLLFATTAVVAACERAPMPEAPAPPPSPPTAVPVVQPPTERPPAPPPPVQASAPPTARDGRLPLVRILAIAQRRAPGEVIKVDLDEDDDDEGDDPPTYDLEILTPEGRVVEIKLEARTGAILDIEED